MSDLTVTKTRLSAGTWEGVVQSTLKSGPPRIDVTHLGAPVEGVDLSPDAGEEGRYVLRVPVPEAAVSDGIHTIVIADGATGETLSSFAILAGEAAADTMRAEMDLLREELDLLKRAFRRHCVETT